MDQFKASGSPTLTAMTYNIHSCIDLYRQENPSAIARVIAAADPDVVALQEVQSFSPRVVAYQRNQARWLGALLDMQSLFYPLREARWGSFGLAVLSKLPVKVVKMGMLPDGGGTVFKETRGAIWCQVETDSGPVHFINTHLGLRLIDRRVQIAHLLGSSWLGGIDAEEPLVFCGDFNAGPRSTLYRQITRRYKDVQGHTGQPGFPKATFHSIYPLRRLDHIFISGRLMPLSVNVARDPAARRASDHLPVSVRLKLEPVPVSNRSFS